ncbi:uncharacterized protein Triagg1_8253 [Trichoderma aggressivum f. europaeum]|uniref:Uncharacterized protein n=1 Tax=Trichoderma aggressivum f. europaeum TaxID=173218 RepID=A0AAE1I8B2_9HYPO|nr:hypothetical protein Triagg1_8253 [Trichoderma aggressivum f. europaeum]
MDQTTKALKRPFTVIRQVWKDYQVGRVIRYNILEGDYEKEECEERCDEECRVACIKDSNEKCKDDDNGKCKETDNETCKEEHDENRNEERSEEREEECSDPNEDQCVDNRVPSPPATCMTQEEDRAARHAAQAERKWKWDVAAEFPWRHEQVVDEESNWRGTWVLEVKDMFAMKWATEIVVTRNGDEREKKIIRKPTRQQPFPVGQERLYLPTEGGQDNSKLRDIPYLAYSPLSAD